MRLRPSIQARLSLIRYALIKFRGERRAAASYIRIPFSVYFRLFGRSPGGGDQCQQKKLLITFKIIHFKYSSKRKNSKNNTTNFISKLMT